MLIIKDLEVAFGKHTVLKNLNLNVGEEIHGIMGMNGSGKTTFLNTLFGLVQPDKGKMLFQERVLNKTDIAYFEAHNFFYSKITGEEYLKLFRLKHGRFDMEGWNKLFGLPLGNLVETYSTGMKKKLAFLGFICLNKPIFVLDEPFNGVDMESAQKIKIVLKLLKEKGKIIIITSHIVESLTSICDSISYLADGNFKHNFMQPAFGEIEEKVFGEFNQENKKRIEKLIG